MSNLYGIHDEEGAHLVPDGGWCVGLTKLLDQPAGKSYDQRLNWLVRLNWGYGSDGTVPHLHNMRQWLDSLLRFVSGSRNVYGYIIGNEPNHENERPSGIYIEPEHYAEFYYQAYSAIKSFNSNLRVIVAAPAPYHANGYTWVQYYQRMLAAIKDKRVRPDGFSIHAYTRSQQRNAIHDATQMDGRLSGTYAGFFTYRDALAQMPSEWRTLPAYLTEFNPIPGWEDKNTGLVKRFYQEIDWWNNQNGSQKILCGILYRYPKYDENAKWAIEGKAGVVEDFREAVEMNLLAPSLESPQKPQEGQEGHQNTIYVPSIQKAPKTSHSPSVAFQRQIDWGMMERRGMNLVEVKDAPAWKVKKVQWFNPEEADRIGPDHHILIDALDENGNRMVGVQFRIIWPTGFHTVTTEAKPGEIASANYPMSPSRNEFSVMVVGSSIPTEMLRGIGMGADLGSGFNAAEHTSTLVVFQRVAQVAVPPTQDESDGATLENLVHPVKDPQWRVVTQGWKENPDFYKKFIYDGVPLQGHNGVDFGTPLNTPIVAVDAGRIVESQDDRDGWGEYVKIVHPWGESLYAHLSRRIYEAGETVMKGQPIGLSGNTGISTGPHLHFGMRIYPYRRNDGMGGFSDPTPYLKSQAQEPPPRSYEHQEVVRLIKQVGQEQNIDWRLLASMAWAESSFRPAIKYGLFQVEDAAWNDWKDEVGATDRLNPLHNARVAARYLRWLISRYPGNLYKPVLAYTWGIGNMDSGAEAPRIKIEYANKVMHGFDLLRAIGA